MEHARINGVELAYDCEDRDAAGHDPSATGRSDMLPISPLLFASHISRADFDPARLGT